MDKSKKETIFALVISISAIIVAYIITSILGVTNIILYESISATGYIITYEVLIWYAIVIPASLIYEYAQKKEQAI